MADSDTNIISPDSVVRLIDLAAKYKKIQRTTFNLSSDNGVRKALYEHSPDAWLVYAAARTRVQNARSLRDKKGYEKLLDAVTDTNATEFVRLIGDQLKSHDKRDQIQTLVKQAQQKKVSPGTANKDQDYGHSSGDESISDHDEEVFSNNDEMDVDQQQMSETPRRDQEINSGTNDEMQWRKYDSASLDATVSLFSQSLADAVARLPHPSETDMMVAAVDLHIPSRVGLYSLGSIMAIRIHGSALFRLARDLFGVNIEQDAMGVYVAYSGGVKIRPQDSLKLEGCRMDAISATVFGTMIYQAISTSHAFQDALRHRHSKTTAVTMTIDGLMDTSGSLFLNLGVVDAGLIRGQLYET